jgi:hypothetical protein
MATPPRVNDTEITAAITRITQRHAAVDDPHLERMGTESRDVLDYLHRYPDTRLPGWVCHADTQDALILQTGLWWDDRRRLHATLRRGRQAGVTLTQLGRPLGIRTAQGTQDLLDRLAALLRHDRPDEKLTRESRRAAPCDARADWIREHAGELRSVAQELLDAADRHGVTGEWLAELTADQVAGVPVSVAVLALAAAEVRTAPTVAALGPSAGVHRTLSAVDRVRTSYARLG